MLNYNGVNVGLMQPKSRKSCLGVSDVLIVVVRGEWLDGPS